MKVFSSRTAPEITGLLQQGAIGVIRTDTLYGTVASALLQPSVERVYQLRDRTPSKPMIILAASVADISDLVRLDGVEERLREFWPGPNSIILPALPKTPAYLHRGTNTLAIRIPDDTELRQLLAATGPLIAPSANPQGLDPASTIEQAKRYFGDRVDFYVDSGDASGAVPSNLLQIESDGTITKLR